MRVREVELSGFRGFNTDARLPYPDGKSVLFYAENGYGKSSVVDALEYWATGNVPAVRRDGVGLGALVHLRADRAEVSVQTQEPPSKSKRGLDGATAGDLQLAFGDTALADSIALLPILRYEDMARFVNQTASQKREELMRFLGLDTLLRFRSGLLKRSRAAERAHEQATGEHVMAASQLQTELDNEALNAGIARLSKLAGLDPSLASSDDLIAWRPGSSGAQTSGASLAEKVRALKNAEAQLASTQADRWNTLVTHQGTAQAAALSELVRSGRNVLPDWHSDDCPLCRQGIEHDQLRADLEARAQTLAAVEDDLKEADEALQEQLARVQAVGTALNSLLDDTSLKAAIKDLEAQRKALRDYWGQANQARRERKPVPALPDPLGVVVHEQLEAAAEQQPEGVGPALLSLARLRGLVETERKTSAAKSGAEALSVSLKAAAAIAVRHADEAIQISIDELNESIASFYRRLVRATAYGDVRLITKEQRGGGIEFSLEWGPEKQEVTPPQRIMSSSQLSALGLALFLARVKADLANPWRTIVLDDVVSSFDAIHKTSLMRLLNDEFADWQILFATHDKGLASSVETEGGRWHTMKVRAFEAETGPLWESDSPAGRLRARLGAGEAADEMGDLARLAIEQALARPIKKLDLRMRYDPDNNYSAREYLDALNHGLDEVRFTELDAPVLVRLRDSAAVTNRICHMQPEDPGPDRADLEVLLEDITELQRLFRCDSCDKQVWHNHNRFTRRSQCQCGELRCA